MGNKRIITCYVINEHLQGGRAPIGAAGSHNDVILRLEFNSMWDGLNKKVIWRDAHGENPTEILLTSGMKSVNDNTYDVPVPAEAKAHSGYASMTIEGIEVANGTTEQVTKSAMAEFQVLKSESGELLHPTADIVDQMFSELEKKETIDASNQKIIAVHNRLQSDYYDKDTSDNLFASKEGTQNALATKADKYDTYTKEDVNFLLSAKANSANVYSKDQTDSIIVSAYEAIDTKANKDDVYTKEYINNNYYTQDAVMGITSNLYASKQELSDARGEIIDTINNGVMVQIENISKSCVSKEQHTADLATKADKEGVYELIEEITITEDGVRSIYRDKEPNGTPYAFKAMLIKGIVEAGTATGRVSMYFRNGLTMLCAYDTSVIATAKRYIKTEVFKRNGLMVCEWTNPSSTIYATQLYRQVDYGEVITAEKAPINNININITTADVYYPVGTTFKIYGVR